MAEDIAAEVGSILQSASINRHPSVQHDANPSTAASEKQPVTLNQYPDPDGSDVGEDEVPVSVLDAVPRKNTMPPLPDLRFEQSYLKSIEQAEGWQGVLWITLRDQRTWCRCTDTEMVVGVNNWKIPNTKSKLRDTKLAKNVSEYYQSEFSSAAQD
ncbi:hypothetical protein CFE70_004386 [Pyrenophora teres f. teres 0-1]